MNSSRSSQYATPSPFDLPNFQQLKLNESVKSVDAAADIVPPDEVDKIAGLSTGKELNLHWKKEEVVAPASVFKSRPVTIRHRKLSTDFLSDAPPAPPADN